MKESSKKRIKVLEYSLTLELMSSYSLAYLLDINVEFISESKSLGNSSSSLGFNQKANLLLDNKSITKEEKQKLVAFMNIRNQFMHNNDVNSYSKAVDNITGLKNKLRKFYPDCFKPSEIGDELEISLEKCVENLYVDNFNNLTDFKGGTERKLRVEAEQKVYKKKFEILQQVIAVELDRVNDFVQSHESESIAKNEIEKLIRPLKYELIVKMEQQYIDEE